jgi:hypothetical protein
VDVIQQKLQVEESREIAGRLPTDRRMRCFIGRRS